MTTGQSFEEIVDGLPPAQDEPPPDIPPEEPSRKVIIDSVPESAGGVTDLRRGRRRRKLAGDLMEPARTDRLPPYSMESEQGVLGCILLTPNDGMAVALETLSPEGEEFYDLRHQTIWLALVEMYDKRETIDIITLQQFLSDKQQLEPVGGIPYLNSMQDGVPSAANLPAYIEIVIEKHLLRKTIRTCTDVVGRVYDYDGTPDELLDGIETDILAIRSNRRLSPSSGINELVGESMLDIETLFTRKGAVTGLATGYADLDSITNGLQAGEMIVLAARPSMGKTSLAMNIAENVAVNSRLPVGVFSLEMTKRALTTRLIASRARVSLRNIQDGFMSERNRQQLLVAAQQLIKATIRIDDTAGLSIMQLRARARRMWQQFDIKLFVIDYLQLVCSQTRRAKENRQLEVSEVSAGVKALAKELNVPVLVLSQLNREIERAKRKPNLSDLRESGSIEQDADLVGFLYKPFSDEEMETESLDSYPVNLLVAKQRNGPTGDIPLTFLRSYTRFESAAKVSDEDVPERNETAQLPMTDAPEP